MLRRHDPLSALAAHYYKASISFGPGLSEEDILRFEESNGLLIPDDLRSFFRSHNGCDDIYFRFLNLSELCRPSAIPQQEGRSLGQEKNAFVFVDYLQWCYWYTVDLTNTPAAHSLIRLGGTPDDRIIASSFSEFLDLYLADDPKLYPQQ